MSNECGAVAYVLITFRTRALQFRPRVGLKRPATAYRKYQHYSAPPLEADYSYDNEGHMTSVTYPTTQIPYNNVGSTGLTPVPGPMFSYGYDSMGRLNTLAQSAGSTSMYGPYASLPVSIVNSVSYDGPAGELTHING